MKNNNNIVSKSNELIQASYRLSLPEQRLVLCCLSKVDSSKEIPQKITLSASEYADFTGVNMKKAYEQLYDAADRLFERKIEFVEGEKKRRYRWIQSDAKKVSGEGAVTLKWGDDILKYISQLNNKFTSYKLKHVSSLTSVYSIRIYELLMQFNSTGKRIIDVDELREVLGAKNKYRDFKGFNQHVISKAIKELNSRSDLTIEYETIKRGKFVHSILFNFKLSEQMKMDI